MRISSFVRLMFVRSRIHMYVNGMYVCMYLLRFAIFVLYKSSIESHRFLYLFLLLVSSLSFFLLIPDCKLPDKKKRKKKESLHNFTQGIVHDVKFVLTP